MIETESKGWQKLLDDYPWFNCNGCYPLPAYSEYMPAPSVGRKPLGEIDKRIFHEDDPFGWKISEIEEEYELNPGIRQIGYQIMHCLVSLGKGYPEHFIHGHGGDNLKDNPYWPPELAGRAGTLVHERFVALLPLMLSRTQDDKGRVTWTFFGNSIHDPEQTFWKNFYIAPGSEMDFKESVAFFISLINSAYNEKIGDDRSLLGCGFRILPVKNDYIPPEWTRPFLVNDSYPFEKVKYLLTFRPFRYLPDSARALYLAGKLSLLPFPGSLVFWGMQNYLKLQKTLPEAGQIPLHNLVTRARGITGLRVSQSGWLHEPRLDGMKHEVNEELVLDSFHMTHRWERIHRYQDELNQVVRKVSIAKALFSTDPNVIGLYDKPLARNSQIWDHKFELLLNGPKADRKKIYELEKIMLRGGLFGYRFFYPPMRVGVHDVYLHRPLVAFVPLQSDTAEILSRSLNGYFTCYHRDDSAMSNPVELWPRMLGRDLYMAALNDFVNGHDHYSHQTPKNIHSLIDSWQLQNNKPLTRSFAHKLLNLAKHKSLEQWLDELRLHSETPEAGLAMKSALEKIIEPSEPSALPMSITYDETANRQFEEAWWNDIKFLAHGEFIYKDNADITNDDITKRLVTKTKRDIEPLGNYFIKRHRKAIAEAGMEGVALCGELPFKWQTDFDFSLYGGWVGNQEGRHHERNILVVIPGKNRKQAVVLGDHYDTAYMEDIFERERGGSGARLAANGADDNYSASATLLQAAPLFLKLSKDGKLERDIWLIHLTGEEFPSDCMGARNFCRSLIEKNLSLKIDDEMSVDLSKTEIVGVYVMDMIGHNRDNDQDVFQISPGKSAASLHLAWQAHVANIIWNANTHIWNQSRDRQHLGRGRRITGLEEIPQPAWHLAIEGEVRTQYNPHSSIFNTDGQIFSDAGIPVVLFMENYDINRTGYHDTKDTLENIDLDYGSAFAAIAIETVARIASLPSVGF
jgi:hypothetical protein